MGIVGILGTVHNENMKSNYNYPLEFLENVIMEFSPQIICGQVRPEDWDTYCNDKNSNVYLGHDEYRKLIIPLCERENIDFEPIDWFEWDIIKAEYGRDCDKIAKDVLKFGSSKIDSVINEIGSKCPIPYNSISLNELVKHKQQFKGGVDPVVHNIYWTARNQIMVERIKNVMTENPGKKILCITSMEHCYFYHEELKKTDWKVIFPLK